MEKHPNCPRETHVHEVQGSVRIAGREPHNHRFATVSCEHPSIWATADMPIR